MLAMLPRCWASSRSGARRALLGLCVCLVIVCGSASGQNQPSQNQPAQSQPAQTQPATPGVSSIDREISELLTRLEAATLSGDPKAYTALLGPDADRESAESFITLQVRPGVTRAVFRERDRLPITDLPDGTGYILVVDAFVQFGERGSVSTWRIDVRRYDANGGHKWLLHGQDRLTVVEGLYKLHLNANKQYRINKLTLTSEDLTITIPAGFAYTAESEQGSTALVLIGEGELAFAPKPVAERGQVKLLAGEETLRSRIRFAFVRVNPFDLAAHFSNGGLMEEKVDPRARDRAQEVFEEQVGKSFGLDLNDLSRDTWSLVPPVGDFLAEIGTARFGTLTYTQAANESEDISLFDRKKRRNISAYASSRKLATRGRFYTDDEQVDFTVEHYDITTNFSPERDWLEGRTVLRLKVRSYMLGTLTLRLADSLAVHTITSPRFGRLLSLRVKNQNSVLVNLPAPLARGDEITVAVTYAGRLETAIPEREVLGLQDAQEVHQEIVIPAEKRTVYTNRSYWYPQSPIPTYATATLRLTVPDGLGCVASGTPAPGNPSRIEGKEEARQLWSFSATQPARYFAVVLTRLSPPVKDSVKLPPSAQMDLAVTANPRQSGRARNFLEQANTILSTYARLVNDLPYPSFNLALVDDQLPGGHSPAYFAILHQPLPMVNYSWRNDPVNFDRYPQFFIAHELAHQFWGDAVGGENYHEQWISEGFAQYFAVIYAEKTRAKDTFEDILRQLRRTAVNYDRYGPVWLGYRLGHLQGDSRIFRALVYNKGALVLHMLRRLVGDEAFFRGIRRFYHESRFKKVGTDDVRKAFEAESGQSLERFFDRWIMRSGVPQISVTTAIEEANATRGSSGSGPAPHAQPQTSLNPSAMPVSLQTETSRQATNGTSVLRVRIEQKGEVYDFPITIRLRYASGEEVDTIVPVTEAVVERMLPLKGRLENVDVNPDEAALVEVIKK